MPSLHPYAASSRMRPPPAGGGLLLAVVLASACAPTLEANRPREPRPALPAAFATGGNAAAAPRASAPSARDNAGKVQWRSFFPDPHLQALIETALDNNQELNIQLQRMLVAKAAVLERQGEYQPQVSAGAGVGVEKVGRHTSQGAADEATGVPEPLANYGFGLQASWEVDVWHRLRDAKKAAVYRYLASVEGRNFVVTQLVAEIARSYYELVALDRQLEVLDANIELQEAGVRVVQLQKQAARVTQLAVQRFEAELLKNRSRRFDLQQRIIEAENRINFLAGRYPQPIARRTTPLDADLPGGLTAGLPSEMLDNRPDVRQAALNLKAAKLDVQVAKKRFYPSLSLEAGVGFESFNAAHLLQPASLLYGIGGSLTAPLLNRKAIEAEYRSADAEQIAAVIEYEQTVLRAFTEVVGELSNIDNLRERYTLQAQQVQMLTESIEVSNVLFQSARADYMEVLLTRRDALESQMELIETQLDQRLAVVDVYHALGGGWR